MTGSYTEQTRKESRLFTSSGGATNDADLIEVYANISYDHVIPPISLIVRSLSIL